MYREKKVSHIIVNNLGGITSLIHHLIQFRGNLAMNQELILIDLEGNINTKSKIETIINCNVKKILIDPADNWYMTFGKMKKLLNESEGVLISNDQYDLIMLQAFKISKKVIQIVHDLYNLDLAKKYGNCIDAFIAHSRFIYDQIKELYPDRSNDIFYIPYGIPIYDTPNRIVKNDSPLKLVFLGRHTASKGIHDLYDINQQLLNKNIEAKWMILGNGPETDVLKNIWKDINNVSFEYPSNFSGVMEILSDCDILVLPTKFEGLPVAMLEAMSVGCVPVVTNLEGGIQDIIDDGSTGYKCTIDDNSHFVEKIIFLNNHREQLCKMQNNAKNMVILKYNADIQMPLYQKLFDEIYNRKITPKHHSVTLPIGSRLDRKWVPNFITRCFRKITNANRK